MSDFASGATRRGLHPASRLDGLGVTLIRQVMGLATPDCINLGLGQVDADVPPPVRAALLDAPSTVRAPYSLNAGLPALRAAIAARHGVSADEVLVTCGTQEALAVSIFGLVNPGDEVLYPLPGFPVYETLTKLAGGVPVAIPLRAENRFRMNWEDIEARLTPRTRAVVLASPGNPTGAITSPTEWQRIHDELRVRDIPWISDEIYLAFQPDGHRHPSMRALGDQGIVVSGLSKSHALAGWRLGWIIAPAQLISSLLPLHQQFVTSVATPVQEAAIAAFSPAGETWLAQLAEGLDARRLVTIDVLQRDNWEVGASDGAFYAWVQVPGGGDDMAFCKHAIANHKVIVIPSRAFGETMHGWFRVSFAVQETPLREGLRRLTEARETWMVR